MRDPYQVLGVSPAASEAEIKKAYRKLAKALHPDMHPGDRRTAERFKDVTAAYDLLGDPIKRKRFDAGEIDAQGQERPQFHHAYGGARPGAARSGPGGAGFGFGASPEELFGQFFGGFRRGRRPADTDEAGPDRATAAQRLAMRITFLEAVRGATRRVTLPDGRTRDVKIPAGIVDGQTIRLRGQDELRSPDVLIEIRVEPHAQFRRDGDDVHVDLPITLREALTGAKIEVPTIDGPVMMSVPRGANSGTILRLRGKGVHRPRAKEVGDQLVHLAVTLPDAADDELRGFVESWETRHPYDPRK
ncbi:MAG: J domain-containing protein [Alphaproteobacteria bacterium]|nr:J domain-containing protein [Alphaproteobacteria bacterium]